MKQSRQLLYNGELSKRSGGQINWLKWGIFLGFWTLFSFLYTNQIYFEMLHNPRMHHSWWRIALWQLAVWYIWACLSPLILKLGRRFPCEGPAWLTGVVIHLLSATVLSAIHIAATVSLKIWIRPFDVWSDTRLFSVQFQDELNHFFLFDFLVYWAIVGVGYAFDYRERYHERESMAAQLKAQLAQAQLESLKVQLHPHFLFNTLHTIAGLVRSDEKVPAVNMIAGLSDLLRRALDNADEQEVSLRRDLDFIKLYLDIQKVRFSDRLTVRMEIAPDTLDALVPNLVLQPLVENAIRHGISADGSAGLIVIETHREHDELHLKISDDGPGLPAGWQLESSEGIGLANTSERLRHLYGTEHQFKLRSGANGGVVVSITIPFRAEFEPGQTR